MKPETFNKGDVIEAQHGTSTIRGTVVGSGFDSDRDYALEVPALGWEGEHARYLTWLKDHDWTLTLVEHAKPVYEPGVYLPGDYHADAYAKTGYLSNIWLYVKGEWWSVPNTWDSAPRRLNLDDNNVSKAVRLVVSA